MNKEDKTICLAFFYFMNPAAENLPQRINDHIAYWKSLSLPGYQGGPFSDKSGGLIQFRAASFSQGEQIALGDPFVTHDCLEMFWVKEWAASPGAP